MSLLDWVRKPLGGLWQSIVTAPSLDMIKSGPGPYAVGTSGLHIWQLDPLKGTGINYNARDTGLVALIRPSTFLKLTTTSVENFLQDPEQFQFYVDRIKAAKPFASPYLCLFADDAGVFVQMQEGRHRMAAILTTAGDHPVPVILHPSGSSFDGPEDLAHMISTRPVIGRNKETLAEDVPFLTGTLQRLKYRGADASLRAYEDVRMGGNSGWDAPNRSP